MKYQVRELTAADASALHEFLNAMPPADRTFFFQDVTDPSVADGWAADERKLRRVAVAADGRILGFSALQPGVDWSAHVADMVLVVAPHARRNGIGKQLARTMFIEALKQGFRKITVLIAADNHGAIEMFRTLGFDGEALLRDQLKSPEDGALHDVVLLAHLVEERWAALASVGIDETIW